MKKLLNVIKSCLCLTLAAFFVACSNGGSDSIGFSEVTIDSVKLPEGFENARSAKVEDKADIDQALNSYSETIEEVLQNSASIETIYELADLGIRSMKVEEFPTILEQLETALEKYNRDIQEKGSGSFSFIKTPGVIEGLPEGYSVEIPLFSLNISQKATGNNNYSSTSANTSQKYISKISEDFTKTMGKEAGIIKNYAANSSQSSSTSLNVVFDMSTMTDDDLMSIMNGSSDEFVFSKYMTAKGVFNLSYETSSVMTFVTDENVAGKIKVSTSISSKINDLGEYVKPTIGNPSDVETADILNDNNTKVSIMIDIYDLEGNFLYNYKKINSLSESEDYISIMSTTSSKK